MIQKHFCWAKILRPSLLYDYFVYFDTKQHLSESIFSQIRPHIRVHTREFANEKYEYHLMLSRVLKKDSERFMEALERIPSKMLICGHGDYIDTCEAIIGKEFIQSYRPTENL